MNINEAIAKTEFLYTDADTRAKVIVMLLAGDVEICDNCGFTQKPGEMCGICENEWADQMAAQEEEMSWGRADMMAGKF